VKILKKIIAIGASVIAMLAVGAIGTSAAAGPQDEQQPSAVEDFNYPGADRILAERGIKLIKGSGSITLVDCPVEVTTDLIWVDGLDGFICFKATSNSGYLTMEIDEVFSLRGDTHNATATVTVDDETETVALNKGAWRGVGVGEDDTKGLATLLEIRVTP
jgi:hypothetical protein